jgi:hypothetical protein
VSLRTEIQRHGPPCWDWTHGWRPCSVKKFIVAKFKEVNTGWHIWQTLLRNIIAQKGCFASDDDDEGRREMR